MFGLLTKRPYLCSDYERIATKNRNMENPFKFGTIVEAFFVLLLWLSFVPIIAQPLCHVTYYDEEDGLPHGHVTQLLQDEQGFMWFATWNG